MNHFFVFLLISSIIISGSVGSNNINLSDQGKNTDNLNSLTPYASGTSKVDLADKTTEINDTTKVKNPFFFENNDLLLNYSAKISFDEVIESDIKLYVNEIATFKYGKLYELKIDPVNGIPYDRVCLGCFYVQEDKIYKIEGNLNKLGSNDEILNDSEIVCQNKRMEDALNKDEPGWHHYIEVSGDKIEYHAYDNQISTGYYESYVWEKGQGLIYYKSGYGAESESIELRLKKSINY